MIKILLLLFMIFCHIVDDYYLQGWLASAKQKSWWENNCSNVLYQNDYIMALIMHAFSWTFMIHISIIIYLFYYNININTFRKWKRSHNSGDIYKGHVIKFINI